MLLSLPPTTSALRVSRCFRFCVASAPHLRAASLAAAPPAAPLPAHLVVSVSGDESDGPHSAWLRDFGFSLHLDFVSAAEASSLIAAAAPVLSRLPYSSDHFDAVIRGYREAQLPAERLPPAAAAAVRRVWALFPAAASSPQSLVHVIDLSTAGAISPHVDSIKFGGGCVAALSLISPARLSLIEEPAAMAARGGAEPRRVDLELPPRSLYIMTRESRYGFAHAIVPSGRRLSVVLRDEPPALA